MPSLHTFICLPTTTTVDTDIFHPKAPQIVYGCPDHYEMETFMRRNLYQHYFEHLSLSLAFDWDLCKYLDSRHQKGKEQDSYRYRQRHPRPQADPNNGNNSHVFTLHAPPAIELAALTRDLANPKINKTDHLAPLSRAKDNNPKTLLAALIVWLMFWGWFSLISFQHVSRTYTNTHAHTLILVLFILILKTSPAFALFSST